MKISRSFMLAVAALMLAAPAAFAAKPVAKQAATTAPAATAPAPAEQPAAEPAAAQPAPTPAPVAPSPAKAAVQEKTTKSIKVGDLEITQIQMAQGGDKIDLFMTIHNNGKADETLSGAEDKREGGKATMIHKGKDGAFYEGPVSVTIPAGKSEELSPSERWVRISGVKGTKAHSEIPVALYFRRSPNAELVLTAQSLSSSSKSLDIKTKDIAAETSAAATEAPEMSAAPSAAAAQAPAEKPAPTPVKAPTTSGQGGIKGVLDWFKK
jgi:copper(I)-binding protein